MKHAYLIIAHNEPEILKTLLYMLDDSRNDIYLHIDQRAEALHQDMLSFQIKRGKLHLIKNRIKVYWGDISQVEVEYLLFETAFNNGPYAYYHLLSGVDLPLKSQDYIHSFFEQHAGKEFVEFWLNKNHEKDLARKVNRYYFFTKQLKNKKEFSHHFTAPLRNIALGIQKLIRYKRKHTFEVFKKGSNWVSITHAFCLYLLNLKPLVIENFQYTLCPDEIFLQTVLWNSPFKNHIYCLDKSNKGSMRKIDWKRGSPYVWQDIDFQELKEAEELFARKFSFQYSNLIYSIKEKYYE